MQATRLWIPYLQASSSADWSLWSLQTGLTSLLSLIFFKESCPSGGSGSKRNYRSPLALDKGSPRNTEALEFCSFIDSIVFCSLLAHTSATRSAGRPLTHGQADSAPWDYFGFCCITNLAFTLPTTLRERQKRLQQRLRWEESMHWARSYSGNKYSWLFPLQGFY